MRTIRPVVVALCVLGLAVVGSGGALVGAPAQKTGQTAARTATPDFQTIARQIVSESVQVKEKEGVVILGDPSKIPLMEAVAVEVAKRGGFPHIVLSSPNVEKRILTEAPLNYLETPNQMTIAEFKQADVLIQLSPVEDLTNLAKVPEERVALVRKATQAVVDTMYTRSIRTVQLGNPVMPSPAIARFYGVTNSDLENRFWQAVNTPHAVIEETGNKVKQALSAGREVHIRTQTGTDLRFRLVEARPIFLNDGQIHSVRANKPAQVWLPAGEVYTAPDPSSVNGTAVVPLAVYRGIKIKNLRLTFSNGKVTQIDAAQNAEALKEALAKSSGDKDTFSFVDIGVNPNSRMIPNSDYCSFEMNGMVTIGIGQAPWAESPNQSEFAQEFFIPHATLEVDGKVIVRDGRIAI